MPLGYPCRDLDEHMVSTLMSFSGEACKQAIEILKERLQQFEQDDQYLSIEIWTLPLSVRSSTALAFKGLHTIKDVVLYGLDNLWKIRNIGPKAEKEILLNNSVKSVPYLQIENREPNYFFSPKNNEEVNDYSKGFNMQELFPLNSLGFLTKRDDLAIAFTESDLEQKILYFLDKTKTTEEVCNAFKLVVRDKDKWDANLTRDKVRITNLKSDIRDCEYRPFDKRQIFYNPYFVARPNTKVLGQLISDNLGLITCRQGDAVGGDEWNVVFISNSLTDQNIYRRGGGTIFPLYVHNFNSAQPAIEQTPTRTPNLNPEIINKISQSLNIAFTPEKETEGETCFANNPELRPEFRTSFTPIDILDYIYAVLHSPTYREKYKEFLKIDFPRVPYPKDADTFWQLVKLGGELRQIHLLESPVVTNYITQYPVDGNNTVTKPKFDNGKVYINDTQYFDGVPETAWSFYIGGYQPAQKWLKDRKDRQLSFEDILHYQKIIVALTETERAMRKIDGIDIE
jgi:predicted helicase